MSQPVDPLFTQNLAWRCIGPHRGGRTVGATGVPGRSNEFYIGVNNGGVWKTNDFGRTWNPVFDDQPTGSIGFVAVAPSSPETVYVGSGEGLQRPDLSVGDGMYKSTDGGKSWRHIGLDDAQQISSIAVDPRDADKVYVAVLGHPYGPNATRGLYKSLDGGGSWTKILGPDDDTGAVQVVIDPQDPQTIYCDLWAARQAPWENGRWQGPQSGLYKSLDGGETWQKLEKGFPTYGQGLGRIGIGIAPSDPKRLFATVDSREGGGIYRSDDAGQSWHKITEDERLWTRGDDFAEIKVDPKNPDIVYCANTASYKSTDGGKTWKGWKGAPGGDDYHTIWIDPVNPEIILLAADQGATITVNGGQTWSSWYNQPTAQFYHVCTDNQWPYWVYGGQQESGSVGICSRGNDGQITFREWHPVAVEEYGNVAPDPLDPNIIYGGKVSKYDKRTGQDQDVSPAPGRGGQYRFLRTAPLLFSPIDPHTLYVAGNVLFSTQDGGSSWKVLSPDLSRPDPDVPDSFKGRLASLPGDELDVDDPHHGPLLRALQDRKPLSQPGRRGVIYAVGPSHFSTKTIWCGTDDGLVWLTRDGGTSWKDVTPKGLTSWSKISQIDAGHFDDDTAYIAVNRFRCDDMKPYVYGTHDGGKSWSLIVEGLPDQPVNTVREDPKVEGMLYCGTETGVYVWLTNGSWSPLRLNMPATSIRDLVVHDDDLVVGTHGRSFWILDNVTSLRQYGMWAIGPLKPGPFLFSPQLATRVRWNMNTDTPLPPEEPGGKNPPDGAMVDYWIDKDAQEVTLEIRDGKGNVVRKYSSKDKPFEADPDQIPFPAYWLRSPAKLSTKRGAHRWLWDMRFDPLDPAGGVPMAAIFQDTPAGSRGPWVPPGNYTVRLTVNGQSQDRQIEVRIDPRVTTPKSGIDMQSKIAVGSYQALLKLSTLVPEVKRIHGVVQRMMGQNPEVSVAEALGKLDRDLAAMETPQPDGNNVTLAQLGRQFQSCMGAVESTEMTPTKTVQLMFASAETALAELQAKFDRIKNDPHIKP